MNFDNWSFNEIDQLASMTASLRSLYTINPEAAEKAFVDKVKEISTNDIFIGLVTDKVVKLKDFLDLIQVGINPKLEEISKRLKIGEEENLDFADLINEKGEDSMFSDKTVDMIEIAKIVLDVRELHSNNPTEAERIFSERLNQLPNGEYWLSLLKKGHLNLQDFYDLATVEVSEKMDQVKKNYNNHGINKYALIKKGEIETVEFTGNYLDTMSKYAEKKNLDNYHVCEYKHLDPLEIEKIII